MEKKRFYINTRGNDDEAYREAMKFACKLADEDSEIKRVVLYTHTQGNTGWLDRLYGREKVKKLFTGLRFNNCKPLFIIKTKKTYDEPYSPYDVVITMGMDSADVMRIDDFYGVKAIIAIPYLPEKLAEWIETWSPLELRTNEKPETRPLPNPIVQEAMKDLTASINMSTGITHPMDEHQAKTYIRALHKYIGLDSAEVASYLIRELGWATEYANDVKKLIDTLNSGKYFQGGDKTHLKSLITNWGKRLK